MPSIRLMSMSMALTLVFAGAAQAQAQTPSPASPYKAVAIALPADLNDPALSALRGQITEITKKRDAAAMARLVVSSGFFWQRDNRDTANKRKSGFDNLSAALGLSNKDSAGWDILAGYADDPSISPSPAHKGAVCTPALPSYNIAAFNALLKGTKTIATDWGYPVSAGIDVHATPQANGAVVDKLALTFVRVMPEAKAASATYLRIATPSGKIGYISIDSVVPLGNDQICYIKDSTGWKIAGYIGGGEPR
jgi:hypothetical protein